MRHFELEKYFSHWEFTAKYHMTASDMHSMTIQELLDLGSKEEQEAFHDQWLGYTQTWGAPDLREAIATTYAQMKKENILCFAGAGEGIYIAARVLLSKEDHAIVLTPNYQSAETIPLEICEVTGVALRHEDNWKVNVEAIKKAIRPNTKLISINFPHNPTGTTMGQEELDALIALCREYDLYLFSDEVYRGVELEEKNQMPQIADIYEKGLSLNVLSKAYGLPGLRIGWLASQDTQILQEMERYKHYLSICNSAPSERLALIAINNKEIIWEKNKAILRKNLAKLETFFQTFPELFEWKRPRGGCVAFPKYLGRDGVAHFCTTLIEHSGVLLLPSSIYHSELTPTPQEHFRIGYGREELFDEGLEAMGEHIQKHY